MKMFRLREVDISEIPKHITAGVKRIKPSGPTDEGLTSEEWEAATEDGVWILQCSKDVNVSEVLTGKKLRLNGRSKIATDDQADEADLTQYVPGSGSLGAIITDRRFETISVPNESGNEGVILLLPDENRFKIVTAPVQGHIIVRESIKNLEVPTIELERPKTRALPAGIKERHPVYGADFTSILKKMEAAPIKSPKKKKKNSGDQEHQLYTSTPSQNGIYSYNGVSSVNDSKQSDSGVKKKKKNQKNHDRSIDDVEDEECAFSNGTLNRSISPIVNISPEASQKKSKKRKREESESFNDFERTDIVEPPVKKNKKTKLRYFE
ncbi:hypothetical protein Ocin01_12048 [Orchesella cincta]|uniref:Uncharacterized protein n=1 Tax=Orchesella cincta TaxID=48709 RepID=A0A1D2MNQ2_ORCCI|nr:hypothetical protein Ocin01_12048 [Orchesella cincta]